MEALFVNANYIPIRYTIYSFLFVVRIFIPGSALKEKFVGLFALMQYNKKFYTVIAQVACTANVFYKANLLKVIFGGKKD